MADISTLPLEFVICLNGCDPQDFPEFDSVIFINIFYIFRYSIAKNHARHQVIMIKMINHK